MDLTRVIPKPDASWIEQINKQEHSTIDAIDIPSGIDSKTEEGLDIFML